MLPGGLSEIAWRTDVGRLLAAQDGLNRSQQEAIARAMTRSITLWQARTSRSYIVSYQKLEPQGAARKCMVTELRAHCVAYT